MIRGEGVAKNPEELAAFLSDVGADNIATFEFLVQDAELLEQLSILLKPLKKKELGRLLQSVLS